MPLSDAESLRRLDAAARAAHRAWRASYTELAPLQPSVVEALLVCEAEFDALPLPLQHHWVRIVKAVIIAAADANPD